MAFSLPEAAGASSGSKRVSAAGSQRGLVDEDGTDHFEKVRGRAQALLSQAGEAKKKALCKKAAETAAEYCAGGSSADPTKPFVGAQPKLLKRPEIADATQGARATKVACRALRETVRASPSVMLFLGQDARHSEVARKLLKEASDDQADITSSTVTVAMSKDWLQTLPFVEQPEKPEYTGQLFIYVGTLGKYMAMCIRGQYGQLDHAYAGNRLVIICRGVCMLPLGTQEENIFGIHSEQVLDCVADALRERGPTAWGHGAGTKAGLLQLAFGYAAAEVGPAAPPDFSGDTEGSMVTFDYLVEYIRYLNTVKLARPGLPVANYYDTGLSVSVLMNCAVEQGPSLLLDGDGLAMLRDASIGHIISKLNQLVTVGPLAKERGVYNFFIGDGACRLNGGAELALHLVEGYQAESLITLIVFNNQKWAIEDNLVGPAQEEHRLLNQEFYNLLAEHARVCICESDLELRETVTYLSERTQRYLAGKVAPGLAVVVVRCLDLKLPPVVVDDEAMRRAPEIHFMRKVLGAFAEDCKSKVPLYGCSAFEFIQFLVSFLQDAPEGKRYQYVCGRTDIQAAHMCGFEQPEGKCVLFINDVFGVNSLGEALRSVLSSFGHKQLLVLIWHPTLLKVIDHFNLHRPPMVWPSLGPELCKYYVRNEHDALITEFDGDMSSPLVSEVTQAIANKTPLIVVNMLPEQECNYISLDVRLKTC